MQNCEKALFEWCWCGRRLIIAVNKDLKQRVCFSRFIFTSRISSSWTYSCCITGRKINIWNHKRNTFIEPAKSSICKNFFKMTCDSFVKMFPSKKLKILLKRGGRHCPIIPLLIFISRKCLLSCQNVSRLQRRNGQKTRILHIVLEARLYCQLI